MRPEELESGSGVRSLKQMRHPIVGANSCPLIANDGVLMGDCRKFKLITGPNMVGESTYITSAAVAIHMTQIGSFVATDEGQITFMDGIFNRVGASDSQLRRNSTL